MSQQRDYTPFQQKVIQRYYDNRDQLDEQRLSELVADLYLAEGKKREKLWTQAGDLMRRIGVPASRIEHVLKSADAAILAEVVQDIHRGAIDLKPPAAKSKTPNPNDRRNLKSQISNRPD